MEEVGKAIALIDGEHYLPVIKEALEKIESQFRYRLQAVVFLGGTEKITDDTELKESLGFSVIDDSDPLFGLKRALIKYEPGVVIDLSDEPVLGYKERFKLASLCLLFGVPYLGADFRFDPPYHHDVVKKPSLAIIGTGKRVGKTAVSAYACRRLSQAGFDPCVVAMGRGGPSDPEVIHGERIRMTPQFLYEESQKGKHAASDYYEDALMSRITTVGCRRCGGGMAGAPFISNVLPGAEVANQLDNSFVVFEGSGAALPPVRTDTVLLTIGAHQPLDYIGGYFGSYRVMQADLAVITMSELPMASKEKIRAIIKTVKEINSNIKIIETVFRPEPLEPIKKERVYLTTTAPQNILKLIKEYLEEKFECKVVGISNYLSHRKLLKDQLKEAKNEFTLILTELKAASVDVVTSIGLDLGVKVVYLDNLPVTIGGYGDLGESIVRLAREAEKRFKRRTEEKKRLLESNQ